MAGIAISASAQTHIEGEEYYKADQLDNAKELLIRSLSNAATDKSVSDYYLGCIALREGKAADAAKYFEQGIAANPAYAYNYVGQGQLALAKGEVKSAETYFKEAEKLGKKDASLQVAIARAYYDVDAVAYEKQITKYMEKARKTNIENPDIYLFEGDQLAAVKDWGGAGSKYEMAANYNADASEAYVKYANLFTMVNPQYAIQMLTKLLSQNPSSALGQRELANAYYNNKDYTNAATEYGKYVNNPSHFKNDEDRYAFLLFYGGNFQDGYDYASKLLSQNPGNFTAQRYQFMNAAQIPEMADQLLPMAQALYANHLKNTAKNKMAAIDYNLIADELNRAGKTDDAIAVLQEGIKDMPDNANFSKQLAMLYVDAGNLTKATEAYRQYIAKNEDAGYNDFVQQATFSFYAAVENKDNRELAEALYDETLENANKALAIMDNYRPKMLIGDVAKQRAANEDDAAQAAVPMYEEAVALLEASAEPSKYTRDAKTLYMYLGNAYIKKDNVAKAKEYYNKYLTLDPANDAVRKYVEGLK